MSATPFDPMSEHARACLERVETLLARDHEATDTLLLALATELPEYWPEAPCVAVVTVDHTRHAPPEARETAWGRSRPIVVRGRPVGAVTLWFQQPRGQFLSAEDELLAAIAARVAATLVQRELAAARARWLPSSDLPQSDAGVAAFEQLVLGAEPRLRQWVARKLLNHLHWTGAPLGAEPMTDPDGSEDENRPLAVGPTGASASAEDTFALARAHLTSEELAGLLRMWLAQDRISFLSGTLEDPGASLAQVTDALQRFDALGVHESELPYSVQIMLRVALLRCFFTGEVDFINTAKGVVSLADFPALTRRLLYPPGSHGKLGGKSAGLFLAERIVAEAAEREPALRSVRVPRTWYIASDAVLAFVRYNHFEDVYDRKYVELDQVRQQYPYVVQAFKRGRFPPELVKGLATALDDLGDRPLIVRSSSLLEDRTGAVFSGKYKSLFLANQGPREERLRALQDAIAEVYASIFAPDPIEYRAERNLLDVHEEMGIMIQEVVGARVGRYFLPSYAGVAFSNNEFRWSPRIRREDGLVRLVPGLGTRAVDRLSDDYPVLFAPGRPGLRANTTVDEIVRYAPAYVDLIDLERNSFATLPMSVLLSECGSSLPQVRRLVSLVDHERMRQPTGLAVDFEQAVVTFEGLATETPFLQQMDTLLRVLRERLGGPVDLEFASDGEALYLLQCRPQCYARGSTPAVIPHDVPAERILFSANRYVSNGHVPDITHIVYVDPTAYGALSEERELRTVGRVVGRLNKLLPAQRFILMGPGRWGSRGDLRLGVRVTYSDVNNTAVLIEIARRRGNYVPDLSFGTHFFQDLVEADIRYLPLYPDEPGNRFNDAFFARATNLLPELLPEYEALAHVVHVIDVPAETRGRVLRVLLNGENDEALAFLVALPGEPGTPADDGQRGHGSEETSHEDPVRWRVRMADRIAAEIDPHAHGVHGLWLMGSVKHGTAGPGSDIDLLVQFEGSAEQRAQLEQWLDGWSLALAEANYARTGVRVARMLNVRYVNAADIAAHRGAAARLRDTTDPPRRLALRRRAAES